MHSLFRTLLAWFQIGHSSSRRAKRLRRDATSFGKLKRRFTSLGKQVLARAEAEAFDLKHEYLGTEHLLLGLLRKDNVITSTMLKASHIKPQQIEMQLRRLIQCGPDQVTLARLPLVPRVRKAIRDASTYASADHERRVGTKHLLFALLSDDECVAYQAIKGAGLNPAEARRALENISDVG